MLRKAVTCLMLLAIGLPAVAPIQGCGEKNLVSPQVKVVSGTVYDQGVPTKEAKVMICYPGDSTLIISPAENGTFQAEVPENLDVKAVVAVTLGKSGMTKIGNILNNIRVDMIPVPQTAKVVPARVNGEYWFGVYSTDGNGDVKFRYQYSFISFKCINYLPWLLWVNGWQNPDPNSWLSWNVSFPSPWKGKFLAVPRRLQQWHSFAYGYSIQQALYLIAIG